MAKSFGQSFSESFGKVLPQTLQSSAQLAAIQQQRELQLGLQYESQKNSKLTEAAVYESKGNYAEASKARNEAAKFDKIITNLYGGSVNPLGESESTTNTSGNRFHPIQAIKSGVKKIFHPAEISGTPNVQKTEQYIQDNNIDINNPPQNAGITEDYSDVADPNNPNIIGGIDTTGYNAATKKKVIDDTRAKKTVRTNREAILQTYQPSLQKRAKPLLDLDLNDEQFNAQLQKLQGTNLDKDTDRQKQIDAYDTYGKSLKRFRESANQQSIGPFKYGDVEIPFIGRVPGSVEVFENPGLASIVGGASGAATGALGGAIKGGKIGKVPGVAIGGIVGGIAGAIGGAANPIKPSSEEQEINDLVSQLELEKGLVTTGKSNEKAVQRLKVPNPNQRYETFDKDINSELDTYIKLYESEIKKAEEAGFNIPESYYETVKDLKATLAKYQQPASAKNAQPQQPKLKDFKNPKKVQSMIDSGMIDFKSAGTLIDKAMKATGSMLDQPAPLKQSGIPNETVKMPNGVEIIFQGKTGQPKPKQQAQPKLQMPVNANQQSIPSGDPVEKELQQYYKDGTLPKGKPGKGNVSSNQAGFINSLAKNAPSLQTIATLANTIQKNQGSGIDKALISQLDKDGLQLLDLALAYLENEDVAA